MDESASSKHIPLVHRTDSIGRFQYCASFGFFQIGHLPFTKITFLDTCQKTVSTHAPQFRSNRSVAPKLMLIIIANVQIYPHLPTRRCIESTFCPREKVINICVSSLPGTSTVAFLSPSLLKNTSAPPPPSQPKHPPRVLKIQVQELLLQQWHPFPRSQRYISPPHLYLCLLFPF